MTSAPEDERAERPGDQPAEHRQQPAGNPAVPFHPGTQAQRRSLKINPHHPGQRGHERRKGETNPRRRVRARQGESGLFADDAMHRQRAEDRCQQHAAQQPAVEVADDFLEHERRGGQRRVERRRQTRRRASRRRRPAVLFRFAGQAGQIGSDSAGQLHAGTFASHAGPATDAQDAGHKFHPRHARRHQTEILPEGELELRNAAAGRLRRKTNSAASPPATTKRR